MDDELEDRMIEKRVTFSIEIEGRLVIVENVPARIDPDTGEEFFSTDTMERLQSIVWGAAKADRASNPGVLRFAA
ncbi:MAG TPA: YgiT-type zinc finger protein [Longimicrobium sp.]|jgi:YgiT-type zinc finger domain-containing protein|uniref:YgiT-type zinc finger protein n=1 Tax=Longimicrobium sp. TaxID=2029185 RepID=UPI002ED7A8A2